MVLFDSSGKVCHPEISWDIRPIMETFISPKEHQPVCLFNHFPFMFAKLDFMTDSKPYSLLIGPCGMIGESPDTFLFKGHVYHYGIHYTKETTAAFEEFVQLAYAFLTHKLLKKEELHWIYQKKSSSALPQISDWRTVYMTGGCKKPLLILINLSFDTQNTSNGISQKRSIGYSKRCKKRIMSSYPKMN